MAFIESGKSFDKDANYNKMKKRMENMDTIQYPLRIPTAMHKKIKMKAVQNGVAIRWILIEALEKYLEKP